MNPVSSRNPNATRLAETLMNKQAFARIQATPCG